MKHLFDLKDRKVTFSPQALLIPELKLIWDTDETEDKVEAIKKLSYIYFLCDYKSPYVLSVPPELAAIDKYKQLQKTPSMGLLEAATITIHKLSDYLTHVDLNERDKSGKPVYKPSDVTNSLKSMGGIVESVAKVQEQIEKETVQKGILRGQRKKGNREDPR